MGEGFAGLELSTGRHCDVTLDVGYRHARASNLTVNGQPIVGSSAEVDYSGFVTRAGVRILPLR
jgi:hypothetical protein